MKLLITFLLLSGFLVAGGGGHHAPGEIPWNGIFYQCLNFFALLGLLFLLLRGKAKAFMADRHDQLMKSVQEAKRAKEAAEKAQVEIQSKLREFEARNKTLLTQVQKDCEALQEKIRSDALKAAQNLEAEATLTIENEIGKAKEQLFEEVINQALTGARQRLNQGVEEPDQRRLQKEFVQKIEAVQ